MWNHYNTKTLLVAVLIVFLVAILHYFTEAVPLPEEQDFGVLLGAIGLEVLAEVSIIEIGKWFSYPKET